MSVALGQPVIDSTARTMLRRSPLPVEHPAADQRVGPQILTWRK
jgi:hypothetical protein